MWIPKPDSEAASASPSRKRCGVLVVDPDPVERRALRDALRQEYRVWVAESAEKALLLLSRLRRLDALLSDFQLPGETGLQLAVKARASRPTLKVFLMTGSGLDQAPRQAFRARADGYLSKPFPLATLKDMLASHLARPRR